MRPVFPLKGTLLLFDNPAAFPTQNTDEHQASGASYCPINGQSRHVLCTEHAHPSQTYLLNSIPRGADSADDA